MAPSGQQGHRWVQGSGAAAGPRRARERLLDLAAEFEELEERCAGLSQSALSQENAELKLVVKRLQEELEAAAPERAVPAELLAENGQLKAQLAEVAEGSARQAAGAPERRAAELERELSRLRAEAAGARERRAEEARRELEAREAAEARASKAEDSVRTWKKVYEDAREAELTFYPCMEELQRAVAAAKAEASKAEEAAKAQAARAEAAMAVAEDAKAETAKAKIALRKAAEAEAAREKAAKVEAARANIDRIEAAKAAPAAKAAASTSQAASAAKAATAEANVSKVQAAKAASAAEAATAKAQAASVAKAAQRRPSADADDAERAEARGSALALPVAAARRRELPPLHALPRSHPWIPTYKPSSTAKVRLFVFYGAGGWVKQPTFVRWQKIVGERYPEVELVVFEWPGHRDHRAEPISDMATFEQQFLGDVMKNGFLSADSDFFDAPFAILGQSTGARVATSIVQLLERFGRKASKFCSKVYIVGRTPPLVPNEGNKESGQGRDFLQRLGEFHARLAKDSAANADGWQETLEADFILNASPLKPLPRKWIVNSAGTLMKRRDSKANPLLQDASVWTPHSEVPVTGLEMEDKWGKWVQLDTSKIDKPPGWLLVGASGRKIRGKISGQDEEVEIDGLMLHEAEEQDQSVDDRTHFSKVPVPFQIHYSRDDDLQPPDDPSGVLRPMREWNRLTSSEVELVEHAGLTHDQLLRDEGVLDRVLCDLVRSAGLR